METFTEFKTRMLVDLQEQIEAGRIDSQIRQLLDHINSHDDYATILSCEGHDDRPFRSDGWNFASIEFVLGPGVSSFGPELLEKALLAVEGVRWVRLHVHKLRTGGARRSIAIFTKEGVIGLAGIEALWDCFDNFTFEMGEATDEG